MSKILVQRVPENEEYYFKEGCHILEMLNSESDTAVSIARARLEVGVTTRNHRLNGVTERYVIQRGNGRVEIGSLSEEVSEGSVVVIPPGTPQRINNTGNGELVFLAICSPRFTPECYEEIPSD